MYKSVTLIEGKDKRGIDVGMISKFDTASTPIYQVPFPNPEWQYTRGILEVTYKLNGGKTATVFVFIFLQQLTLILKEPLQGTPAALLKSLK